jgi:hypothetical protein
MIYIYETLNKEEIVNAIEARKAWITDLKRMLPYADHGAYGQDLARIADYERDIVQLKRALAVASALATKIDTFIDSGEIV